jgi:hypothetical protein
MKIPNNDIPPDMNWADYCDALNNERFLRKIHDRKTSQDPEHHASVPKDEQTHLANVSPLP